MKKWLRAQPAATSLDELQHLLDTFVDIYNHQRPPPLTPTPSHTRHHLHHPPQSHPR
ncbi:MAG: hypothetical protein ABIR32_19945 [Ilumatobacteraceae bacterium]